MRNTETNKQKNEINQYKSNFNLKKSFFETILPAGLISVFLATIGATISIGTGAIHGAIRGRKILSSKNPGADLIKLYENPSFIQRISFNVLADESMRALKNDKEKFRQAFLYIVKENRHKIVEEINKAIMENMEDKGFNRKITNTLDEERSSPKTPKISEFLEVFQEAKELAEKEKNPQLANYLDTKIKSLEEKRVEFQNLLEESVKKLWDHHNTVKGLEPFKHEYVELPKEEHHWTDKEIVEFVNSPQYEKFKQLVNQLPNSKPLTQDDLKNTNKKQITQQRS